MSFIDKLSSMLGIPADREKLDRTVSDIKTRLNELEARPANAKTNPFVFELKNDSAGYADGSWEEIIRQGQAAQAGYRDKSESYWQDKQGNSPSGRGWYGSFEAPKVVILCTEPVYNFRNTARLAGSFQVTSHAHMGSVLRFHGDGPSVLKDDNGWWHQTNAPIGMYVEPSTLVEGRDVRNFEQAISNVTIVGHRGSMPIYISDNAFNFRLNDCNLQSHQGSRIIVKHGPAVGASWYPVKQKPSGNNYLPDPVFKDCLIEGVHKWDRRNTGICVSGNNIQFHGLNFYGVVTGIMSTGQGRTVSACTLHHGATGDGRTWGTREQMALAILSRREGQNPDSIQNNPTFPVINPIKQSRANESLGWYQKGEAFI